LPLPAAIAITRASTRRHGRARAPRACLAAVLRSLSKGPKMPKMKTKSGAKKRFSRTASGKVKANVAHKRHRLISKPKQMKRKARGTMTLEKGDSKLVLTYMPYMRG
jgi:large subunit ribosomal protein L35